MARKRGGKSGSADDVRVISYRHLDKRKNNPDVGMVTPESVGSSRVDLQACKLEYSIVSPK